MYASWSRTPSVCSELERVLAQSVFVFFCFFFLQQNLLAETWGREGPEVGSPPPSAELCLAVSLVGSRRD